jgi:cytochrome c
MLPIVLATQREEKLTPDRNHSTMLRIGEMGVDWLPFLKSKRRFPMKIMQMESSRIFAAAAVAVLNVALCTVAVGQDHATAQDVVAKVREAASALAKTGDVAQFNQKQGPWVWKDTYIFVLNCDNMTQAAHPLRADLIGTEISSIKDPKGNAIFPKPKGVCEAARKPSGTWAEYSWAKPGEKEGSRKVTYLLGAKGTPYVVAAGVYDDKASIAELSKLSSK